jgi:hypothetical protein
MLVSKSFLKFCENRIEKHEKEKQKQSRIMSEMTEHLSLAISENSGVDISSPEATNGSKNIEVLSKAYAQLQKAESEQLKLELQIAEAKKQRMVNWDIIIPKATGIVVAGAVTIFWICLEQGTPLPMRLVKLVSDLTLPRNI